MNTLQFAKEVAYLLGDIELKNIIMKASSNGFTVPGFKSPWKAPRVQIIGSLFEKKKRGGEFFYIIFLKTAEELGIIIDENFEISKLINMWLLDENSHEEIEKQIKEFKQKKIETDNKQNGLLESKSDVQKKDKDLDFEREIEQLEEKYNKLKENNQRLKEVNQNYKIALDNLNKTNKQLQKENIQLKDEIVILNEKNEKNINTIEEMKKQIDDNESWKANTKCQIKELEKYKQRAPKIFCLCKNKIEDILLDGYDITIEKIWNDEVKNSILTGCFTEIWFVSKGFSYNVSFEIREFGKGKVRTFLNVDKMISEIGGVD